MQRKTVEPPEQAREVLEIVGNVLGSSMSALYLCGSAVSGGLRPRSDIDLLAVIDCPTTEAQRKGLLAALLEVSGRHPARPGGPRCIELVVLVKSELAPPRFPARAEFIYGEWLRDAFEAGEIPMPVPDPEVTLLLAQARQDARPLLGPDPAALLPIVPDEDIRRAIGDAIPPLLATLKGDERNVLLTLARMWRTLATGEFVPKDVAAEWAMSRLPATTAEVIAHARQAYLGAEEDGWQSRQRAVRHAANELRTRVAAML